MMFLSLIAVTLIVLSAVVFAEDHLQKKTLSCIDGVIVDVNEITEFKEFHEIIKTDVELELRRDGVTVRDEYSLEDNTGRLLVSVTVQVIKDTSDKPFLISAYAILRLEQPVWLYYAEQKGQSQNAVASTWVIGAELLTSFSEGKRLVRETVSDCVREFINDYLAVHTEEDEDG
jgi:hypothetical protein